MAFEEAGESTVDGWSSGKTCKLLRGVLAGAHAQIGYGENETLKLQIRHVTKDMTTVAFINARRTNGNNYEYVRG